MYMYAFMYVVYMNIFTTEGFFEVALESWPEWDLKVVFKPTTTEFRSDALTN